MSFEKKEEKKKIKRKSEKREKEKKYIKKNLDLSDLIEMLAKVSPGQRSLPLELSLRGRGSQ